MLQKLKYLILTLVLSLTFLISPTQAATLVAEAGTTITIDVSNLKSSNVVVLIDNKEILQTPVLGSNVGLKVPIPKNTTNGKHILTVVGVEKEETTDQDLIIFNGSSALDAKFWLIVAGAFLVGIIVGLALKKRRQLSTTSNL